MTRLKECDLETRRQELEENTTDEWTLRYYNGMCHLTSNGCIIAVGTKRQVYDAMYYILVGLRAR